MNSFFEEKLTICFFNVEIDLRLWYLTHFVVDNV